MYQLGKDKRERACNVDDDRKKTHSSLTGFMAYKRTCAEEKEKSDSMEWRNYWAVADIPNLTIHKLFVSTFGPEKSGMLQVGKKKEVQLAFLNYRDKMEISFTKVHVDAYLDKLAMDLEAA
eukprot:scaffold47917_cov45-Attheya_sp.AAC.1